MFLIEAYCIINFKYICFCSIYHIVFNSIAQLAIGIPLELVHKFWRVGLVYVLGVLAGSLAVSVTDPKVYLAGASGGVYALIAAHAANLVVVSFWLYMLEMQNAVHVTGLSSTSGGG